LKIKVVSHKSGIK